MNEIKIKTEEFYENKYQHENEPWDYSKKAVEILRHEFIVNLAGGLKKDYLRILDVGCGKGQLTFQLDGKSRQILGIDVSETALSKARSKFQINNLNFKSEYFFTKDNITSTSFPENHFDLVLLCDGINEWFDDEEKRIAALKETCRILNSGGFAIISDYQKEKNFDNYIKTVNSSPLKIVSIIYFHDRLCYQFYSWFKAIEKNSIIQSLYKSRILAKVLIKISSSFGRKGAKHLFVVAIKSLLVFANICFDAV